jgi:hypothetical protein
MIAVSKRTKEHYEKNAENVTMMTTMLKPDCFADYSQPSCIRIINRAIIIILLIQLIFLKRAQVHRRV